jgi:circadian clock protein KaiB
MENIESDKSPPPFRFVLYVSGGSPFSEQAVSNLRKLCIEHLQEQHEFEIVDVFCEPARALADRVMMTPTLLKVSPGPVQRIVGSLNLGEPILRALGLHGGNAALAQQPAGERGPFR